MRHDSCGIGQRCDACHKTRSFAFSVDVVIYAWDQIFLLLGRYRIRNAIEDQSLSTTIYESLLQKIRSISSEHIKSKLMR